jgi:hypothetical protein
VSDTYTIARTLLEASAEGLKGTYAGTPDRRYVSMGTAVHDVPDQLTVHLPNMGQDSATVPEQIYVWGLSYVVTITRPFPGQPGDSGIVLAKDLDEASKIMYEDFDALLQTYTCNPPLGAEIQQVSVIEPLGGVSGWTFTLSIRAHN